MSRPLPIGIIAIWSGAIVNIPAGWHLCDGNNGTPDFLDYFAMGAGGSYDPGDEGGQKIHQHNILGIGHAHGFSGGLDIPVGTDFSNITSVTVVTGLTDYTTTRPPFYALAFIMKIL